MVLRRTLPSRVSAEPEADTGASQAAQTSAPTPQTPAEPTPPPAPSASPEEQNAAIAAALDDDFPGPQSQPAASLEESFASASQLQEEKTAPQPQPEPAEPPQQAEQPQAETETPKQPETPKEPSRPAANPLKPKVRQKKPRNFAFSPAEAPKDKESASSPQPETRQEDAEVEQTEADPTAAGDRLETYGLLSEPADVLTSAAAPAPATVEDETPLPEAPFSPAEEQPQGYVSPNMKDDETPADTQGESTEDAPQAKPEPEQSSDLPWQANAAPQTAEAPAPQTAENADDDWGVGAWESASAGTEETPASPSDGNPFNTGAQPIDIYAPGASGTSASPYGASAPSLPGDGAAPARKSAPELPRAGGHPRTLANSSSLFQWGIGAAVVAAVAVGVYQLVKNDASQERVARLTGALTETTERLPTEMGGVQSNPGGDMVAPEQVIAMDGGQPGILPPPPVAGGSTFQPLTPATTTSSAVIDFADVPASEAARPIVADGTEQMPEDIGLIAKFQQAVAAEKARQSGTDSDATAPKAQTKAPDQSGLSPAEKESQNLVLQQKLQAELAAYRETLATAEKPSQAPKPSEFLRQEEGATPAAPATQTAALQPPASLPAEQPNPANLPILPEPTANTAPPVRTLADFDVEAFAADKERVRIPKGIRPRFSSTDFPQMEVLSFVPGRGIIAFNRGREGVLLIGESLEGWELMNVTPDSAEFRNGKRTQYVSAE